MADPRPEKLPLELFQSLPKADLHVHLDGSLRLETIIDLAFGQKLIPRRFSVDELFDDTTRALE